MRYLSVCSGMEAASVAWHPLGWQPIGFSEIEPFPCAILKHRFPNTPNYGDLTQYQQWPISTGDVDLIAGGPPCQAFSVAGLRRGLADPRGNLTLTYLGLVDKFQPKYVVYENVPGLLSVDGGTAFGSFLGGLAELGYSAAWRVLDAQYVGSCRLHPHKRGQSAVPQRRRRVFVVAVRGAGNWRLAAEVLSIAEGMRGNTPSRRKKGQGSAAGAEGGIATDHQLIGGIDYEHNPHGPNDVTGPLLKGSPTGGGHPLPAIAYRKSKRACSTTDNETWVEADASNTLNNFDLGDTRTTHAVVEPRVYENHPNDSRVTGPLEVSPTVVSRFGTGGGNVPIVNNEPVTFQPGNLRRDAGADPSTTTTTTLKASAGDQMPHIATAMAVRRLTPNECYRLQGFPDNWGRIPWKGKPAEECPDGPQYKACGNSMAVPVMAFIGRRIAAADAKHFPHA